MFKVIGLDEIDQVLKPLHRVIDVRLAALKQVVVLLTSIVMQTKNAISKQIKVGFRVQIQRPLYAVQIRFFVGDPSGRFVIPDDLVRVVDGVHLHVHLDVNAIDVKQHGVPNLMLFVRVVVMRLQRGKRLLFRKDEVRTPRLGWDPVLNTAVSGALLKFLPATFQQQMIGFSLGGGVGLLKRPVKTIHKIVDGLSV